MIAKRTDPAVLVRLPRDVLKEITASAKKNGRSRNSHIVAVLAQFIGQEKSKVQPQAQQ